MINTTKKNTLIVIVGPTAVGKTLMAIEIARYFHTEILSADSRQFYKELQIGVASPSNDELKLAKHHFIGNLSIHENYNVSKFENEALHLLSNLFKINNNVVLVGGSGLYIDAVCKGIDELPDPEESLRLEIKENFEEKGIEYLRNQLKILDLEYYNQVDLANPKRLMRAIEVCLTTGKTFTSLRVNQQKTRNFNIIKIGLEFPRDILYERINKRVDVMIEEGLLAEAEALFGFKSLNALNTVGYKEIFDYMDGKVSLEFAIEKIKINSRRYAKRQLTWFKRDKDINWFDATDKDNIIDFVEASII